MEGWIRALNIRTQHEARTHDHPSSPIAPPVHRARPYRPTTKIGDSGSHSHGIEATRLRRWRLAGCGTRRRGDRLAVRDWVGAGTGWQCGTRPGAETCRRTGLAGGGDLPAVRDLPVVGTCRRCGTRPGVEICWRCGTRRGRRLAAVRTCWRRRLAGSCSNSLGRPQGRSPSPDRHPAGEPLAAFLRANPLAAFLRAEDPLLRSPSYQPFPTSLTESSPNATSSFIRNAHPAAFLAQ
ncbi:hypothetical protein HD596_005115 [Nonomuraea jabiensis]|uniref:Uncharacterized protein n=1 Tax=Nonomuraea jabiensis TaxID=882448 RepID=A0A7W9G737_9ACTN|nr:hypothetical protein [Nonomuraea jabiensis]